MPSLEEKKQIVKESLSLFVQEHIGEISLSGIDDIVIIYVVGILEEIANTSGSEEAFDVEHFTEMMTAYFPDFGEIESAKICTWMFNLGSELSESRERKSNGSLISYCDTDTTLNGQYQYNHNLKLQGEKIETNSSHPCIEDVTDGMGAIYLDQQIQLQEMFPNLCNMEIYHCLCIANGNTEKATQLVIHRHETGQSILPPNSMQTAVSKSKSRNSNILDDKQLKESVLSRYAYVDKAEDERDHKPVAPKTEPKKLVRYRDNQIVSVKGEKYSEIKSEEHDDIKKTYVTLKPARQYRFH